MTIILVILISILGLTYYEIVQQNNNQIIRILLRLTTISSSIELLTNSLRPLTLDIYNLINSIKQSIYTFTSNATQKLGISNLPNWINNHRITPPNLININIFKSLITSSSFLIASIIFLICIFEMSNSEIITLPMFLIDWIPACIIATLSFVHLYNLIPTIIRHNYNSYNNLFNHPFIIIFIIFIIITLGIHTRNRNIQEQDI